MIAEREEGAPGEGLPGLLPGESGLEWIPMAVRRALDRAGLRISLRSWQALSMKVRRSLVQLGAAAEVDRQALRSCLAHVDAVPCPPTPDPRPDRLPAAVARHGVGVAQWRAWGPVVRHALVSYAERGKPNALRSLVARLQDADAAGDLPEATPHDADPGAR